MAFVLGVSSGIFGAAPEAERIQYAGLYKKAQYCITKGVEFVQIDLESVAEFKDPDLKENMEKIKQLGVTFGIHSETRAFGVEIAELDSAIETDYKFGQERLKEILERAGEIGSKYVLIHSSESDPFLLLERHLQPAILVDFWGNTLRSFLEKNQELLNWAITGEYLKTIEQVSEEIFKIWMGKKKEERKRITEEEIKKVLSSQDFIWRELLAGVSLSDSIRRTAVALVAHREVNMGKSYEEMSPDEERAINELVKNSIKLDLQETKTRLLDYIQSRSLAHGPERIAYYFVAKWMEMKKDPLWEKIIKNTLEYFAKVENKTVSQWLSEKKIEKLSIEDDNFRLHSYIWVPAVSAKYIWGHLNQDKNPGPSKYPDFKPILKKYNMPLVLETPMAHRGIEEWLRLPNPIQMYHLVKEVGPEYVQLALDIEHMLSIRLDPEKVIDCLPDDAGKFVRVIHAGYPAPLAPAHIPIPLGSEQQVYLYKMYYKLWKKGLGKETNCFLVFERGGGPDPIQQSVIALRKIVEFLEKDIKPEDLIKYPDFFGLAVGEIASPERQMSIIYEHAWDPLRGLIVGPEETYTFLGRAALEKGKRPEEWKKEELR